MHDFSAESIILRNGLIVAALTIAAAPESWSADPSNKMLETRRVRLTIMLDEVLSAKAQVLPPGELTLNIQQKQAMSPRIAPEPHPWFDIPVERANERLLIFLDPPGHGDDWARALEQASLVISVTDRSFLFAHSDLREARRLQHKFGLLFLRSPTVRDQLRDGVSQLGPLMADFLVDAMRAANDKDATKFTTSLITINEACHPFRATLLRRLVESLSTEPAPALRSGLLSSMFRMLLDETTPGPLVQVMEQAYLYNVIVATDAGEQGSAENFLSPVERDHVISRIHTLNLTNDHRHAILRWLRKSRSALND
jgi:hypothetical protein